MFGLQFRVPLALCARRPAASVFRPGVLLTVRGHSANAVSSHAPRQCPVCPVFWFSIREAYRKPSPLPGRSAQDRTTENTTPSNPQPGSVTHPLGGAVLSAGLARGFLGDHPSSTSSRSSAPQRRVQTTEKAPQNAPEGLYAGPVPGLETRYQCRSHSSYRDTGPETGFGVGELTRRRWRSLQRGPDRPTAPLSPRRNSRGW